VTEHAIPLELLTGKNSFDPVESETLPRTDPVRGVFITSRGTEIELADNPISALIVQRLQSGGKPKIPMIEVTLLGKHKQLEPFPDHEGYKARLKEWEEDSQMALMQYLFTVGTKGTPPPEFVEEQHPYFPNATDNDMKYLWVASRLPDEDMGLFTEAVMGRSLPTAKGLDESADTFRSES
jgi:hypothetical protein